MLTIGYFTKWPAIYKEREKSVKDVVFTSIVPTINEDTILITSSTNKYTQEMEIKGNNIHLNSPCKVFCSCESFKYEFSNAIFRSGSLLRTIRFIRSIISRPKRKNEFNIASGCKHIVALARAVLKIKLK